MGSELLMIFVQICIEALQDKTWPMALLYCSLRTAFAAGLRGCSCIFLDVTAAALHLSVLIVLWAFPSLRPDMTTYAALHMSDVKFEADLAQFKQSPLGIVLHHAHMPLMISIVCCVWGFCCFQLPIFYSVKLLKQTRTTQPWQLCTKTALVRIDLAC